MNNFSSWHVGVAAEAIAAGQFARLGYDVSVQYGANQPEYDLLVAKDEDLLRVSVKGSKDGGWGLTQSFIKNADYQSAIADWLARHKRRTVICLVQFQGVAIDELPRLYLASPEQVAAQLAKSAKGRGETILYENKSWGARAFGAGTVDKIPDNWKFSAERITEFLQET